MTDTPDPNVLLTDAEGFVPIAIIGSRSWPDDELYVIDQYIERLPKSVRLISGDGGKVDLRVRAVAARLQRRFTAHPIDKTGLPSSSDKARLAEFTARAYARDRNIARDCRYLVAFFNPYKENGTLNTRGGTRYTVKVARDLLRPVLIFLPKGVDPNDKRHRI